MHNTPSMSVFARVVKVSFVVSSQRCPRMPTPDANWPASYPAAKLETALPPYSWAQAVGILCSFFVEPSRHPQTSMWQYQFVVGTFESSYGFAFPALARRGIPTGRFARGIHNRV